MVGHCHKPFKTKKFRLFKRLNSIITSRRNVLAQRLTPQNFTLLNHNFAAQPSCQFVANYLHVLKFGH